MNIKDSVQELKEMTARKSLDFSSAMNYFLDHIGENPLAMKQSKPYKENKEYFKALFIPILDHQGEGVKLLQLRLVRMEKYGLVHGSAIFSNNKIGMLYYFEDIQMGIASVAQWGTSHTDHYRLSSFISDQPPGNTTSPTEINKTAH